MCLHHYSGGQRINLKNLLLILGRTGSLIVAQSFPIIPSKPRRLWSSFIWEDHRESLLPCGPSQPLFFLGLVVCFLICTGLWSETSAGLPIPCVSTQAMVHSCLGASRCPIHVPFPMCTRSFLQASLKACVCCLCRMKGDVCVHCFGSDVVSLENKQTSRSLWRITSQLGCLVSNLCTVAGDSWALHARCQVWQWSPPERLWQMMCKCPVCDGFTLTWQWSSLFVRCLCALHSRCRQSTATSGKWQEHEAAPWPWSCLEKSARLIWSEGNLCAWVKDPKNVCRSTQGHICPASCSCP